MAGRASCILVQLGSAWPSLAQPVLPSVAAPSAGFAAPGGLQAAMPTAHAGASDDVPPTLPFDQEQYAAQMAAVFFQAAPFV